MTLNKRPPQPVVGPLIVGGTGGSGTRYITQILRAIGIDLGEHVNESDDALAFVELYDTYIDPFWGGGDIDPAAFDRCLRSAVRRHRDGCRDGPWGWKNPRSIFLLPLLAKSLPDLYFIHVIRHGMDMATSVNQNQMRLHGQTVLGPQVTEMPRVLAAARLWKRVNLSAANFGGSMGDRYLRVRYEEACRDPMRTMKPVISSLDLPHDPVAWPAPIPSIPRWTRLAPAERAILASEIGDALAHFGYTF